MKKYAAIFAIPLAAFALSGCLNSSTLTEEDKKLPDVNSDEITKKSFEVDMDKSFLSFKGGKGGVIAHQGEFEGFEVTITQDKAEPMNLEKAKIDVKIDITSMKTDNDGLTAHLLNEDFFESETYPEANFASNEIEKIDGDRYKVSGQLLLKGVQKALVLETQINDKFAHFTHDLNRMDFNIGEEGKVDDIVPLEAKLIFK